MESFAMDTARRSQHIGAGESEQARPFAVAPSFWLDFVCGALAGGLVKTCTAPVERVKLIMQTQDANPLIRSWQVARYEGSIFNTASRIYREQGLLAFWRGNVANIIRYIPQQACNLSFKDAIKKQYMPTFDPTVELWKFTAVQFVSGGLGAGLSLTCCYPLDYARTRLATDVGAGRTRTFNGIFDCIKKSVQRGGLVTLYSGYKVALCDVVVYRAIQLGCFDTLNTHNPHRHTLGWRGIASGFVAALAGTLCAIPFAFPLDTTRRRLMLEAERPEKDKVYKTTLNAFRVIFREEGIRGFYKGVVPSMLRSGGSSLVPVFYDKFKILLLEVG